MRILMVCFHFPPENQGGTEIYTCNLAKKLLERGHEVYIFHRGDNILLENGILWLKERYNLPIFAVNNPGYPDKYIFERTYDNEQVTKSFTKVLDMVRPDLVHINHLHTLSFSIIRATKEQGLPLVMTLHDYWNICPQTHIHKNYEVCLQKTTADCTACIVNQGYSANEQHIEKRDKLAAELLQTVDVFISPSKFLKEKFQEFFQINYKEFLHIPNGINVENMNFARTVGAKEKWDSQEKLRIGYFSNIIYQKGLHILLGAFQLLDQRKYTLYIRGSINTEYGKFLDSKFPFWRKYYHEAYENTEVVPLMRENADVIVFPSVIYENYPTTINEAFLAQIPVLGSDFGGISDMIENEQNGLLFQALSPEALAGKLNRLIEDPNLLETMIDYLRNKSEPPISFDQHVLQIETVYNRLHTKEKIFSSPVRVEKIFNLAASIYDEMEKGLRRVAEQNEEIALLRADVLAKEKAISYLKQQIQEHILHIENLEELHKNQVQRILNSASFRLGRLLTRPYRALRSLISKQALPPSE